MPQPRENPGPSPAAPDLSGTAQRIAFLEEYLGKRIAEAEAAEARLGKRLEAVTRAEESLKGLFDSLRKQVAEACPVLDKLGTFQKTGQEQLTGLVKEFEQRLAQAQDTVKDKVEDFEAKAGVFEDWLTGQLAQAQTSIAAALTSQSTRAMGEMQQGLDRRLETFRRGAGEISRITEQVVRQAMDQVHAKAEAVADDLCRNLESLVEQRLLRRMRELRPRVMDAAALTEKMLSERLVQMLESARASATLHEGQIARQVEAIRPRIAAAVRVMEAEVSAATARLVEQAERETTALENRLAQRVDELMETAHRSLRSEMRGPVEVELFVNPHTGKPARNEVDDEAADDADGDPCPGGRGFGRAA